MDNSTESLLLYAARNGDIETVKSLVSAQKDDSSSFNLNCTGKQKANKGWGALHLAAYFGHTKVVKFLIENGADINLVNDVGDTPLHRAAFTGRQEIVLVLLQHGADVRLINAEGNSAYNVAMTTDIKSLIEAAEKTEQKKNEEAFLKLARDGNHEAVTTMLKSQLVSNINCSDMFGNTALHLAAMNGRKQVVVILLQAGIDATLHNARNQTAGEVTSDAQMKMLLGIRSNQNVSQTIHRHEGLLFKKVRLFGWRAIWVVLERGVLSVFASRADATTGCNRKWFKYLTGAKIQSRLDTPHLLTVTFADNKSVTFSVGNDPSSLVTRQKWENALLEHISCSLHLGGRVIDDDKDDEVLPLGCLQDTLRTAQAYQQVVEKQVSATLAQLTDQGNSHCITPSAYPQLCRQLSELVNSSKQMSSSLSQCLAVFIQQDQVRRVQLEQEMEKSRILEECLRVLAQEHLSLEQSISGLRTSSMGSSQTARLFASSPSAVTSSEMDEFFDCDSLSDIEIADDTMQAGEAGAAVATFTELDENISDITSTGIMRSSSTPRDLGISVWGGRCRLPVPMSRSSFSVWAILKQCIGRELSRITMPVIFNEPLSFLERMVEYMEYAELLKQASRCDDPLRRLELVTAFAVSATASNWDRIGKPFNPLLGETYHLDRENVGFRVMCEQVSHHPPVSAFHVESADYTFHGAVEPKLKFWGKSVEVTPKGLVTLILHRHGEAYSWQYVNCCVHNIIVGKMWFEHYGVMEVTNHKSLQKSVVDFKACGWFGNDLHKVEGFVFDMEKAKQRALYGKWTESFYSYDASLYDDYVTKSSQSHVDESALADSSGVIQRDSLETDMNGQDAVNGFTSERVTKTGSAQILTEAGFDSSADNRLTLADCQPIDTDLFYDLCIRNQTLLWKALPKPPNSSQYYNFTLFAMMLNELNDKLTSALPPTDSRLRPDIRKMENGDIDGAACEKNRLEEKQRAARKQRGGDSSWKPRWFKRGMNVHTGKEDWLFTGEYWSGDWTRCPDIF